MPFGRVHGITGQTAELESVDQIADRAYVPPPTARKHHGTIDGINDTDGQPNT